LPPRRRRKRKYPIKLTENRYLNPEVIADVEYTPKDRLGEDSFFTVIFSNNQLLPVHLKGDEAEEAFMPRGNNALLPYDLPGFTTALFTVGSNAGLAFPTIWELQRTAN
jgi:hypothetical protein